MTIVGYSLSESGIYRTPPIGLREDYMSYVDMFPVIPSPEAFGLHSNADITKDMNGTTLILYSLLLASADAIGKYKIIKCISFHVKTNNARVLTMNLNDERNSNKYTYK